MSDDDVRLDLDLAADAEIDRQVENPQPILLLNNIDISGTFSHIVAYKNCADVRVPRGIFEARCVARRRRLSLYPTFTSHGEITMTDEHAAARAMYQDYVARAATLERNRRFANEVVRATSGSSKTPVEPLATMGKAGGPLRCDVCGMPMLLEGGGYDRVHADVAWHRNPEPGWTSYISGGMVVSVESNRTLRIYHGYPGRSGCVQQAEVTDERSRAEFRERSDATAVSAKMTLLRAYLKAELPHKATDAVMSDIYRVLFVYDPGVGINGVG